MKLVGQMALLFALTLGSGWWFHHLEGETSAARSLASEAGMCDELAVGDTKRVGDGEGDWQHDPVNTLTKDIPDAMGINANYALTRVANNHYIATLPVEFIPESGVSDQDIHTMERKVRECLREADSFRAPIGQVLELRLSTEENPGDLPGAAGFRRSIIHVHPGKSRGNAGNYYMSFDCPTINHEMLHLMGLLDEYREELPRVANGQWTYPLCRVEPVANSIMRGMVEVYLESKEGRTACTCDTGCKKIIEGRDLALKELYVGASFADILEHPDLKSLCHPLEKYKDLGEWSALEEKPQALRLLEKTKNSFVVEDVDVSWDENSSARSPKFNVFSSSYRCSCAEDDQTCKTKLAFARHRIEDSQGRFSGHCPPGTSSAFGLKVSFSASSGQGIEWGKTRNDFFMGYSGGARRLITASHMERIIAGSCETKAKPYNECAKFGNLPFNLGAASSAAPARPNEGYVQKMCAQVPARCQDPRYYLGVPW